MRFNWFHALCVLAIPIVMLELRPFDKTARHATGPSVTSPAWNGGVVANNAAKRTHDELRRDR